MSGAIAVASSSPQVVPLPYSVETNVDPEEAFAASLSSCHMLFFLADAVILDVRTRKEFEESHITGSVDVPVQNESFEDMVAKLDPNKKYIVHCTANHYIGRTNRALKSMQTLGFKHLYSLKGGYDAWNEAELPLTETSD